MEFSWSLNPTAGSSPTFNWRIVSLSVILWIALMPVFSSIHEYGHAFICGYNDMPYNIQLGLNGASVACSGSFDDPTPFRLAGGFLASGIALISAVFVKKLVRTAKNSFLYIPLFVIGVVQFGQMISEGFFNTYYMTSQVATLVPTLIAFILLMSLTLLKSKHFEEEKMHEVLRRNNQNSEVGQDD